jgi:tRNA 2-thiouridine synthesizing protein A
MADFDPSSVEVAKIVDARGSACPGPLLEAKKAIGSVSVGQTIEVLSGDASTKTDIPKWAEKTGHEFLGAVPAEGYDRIFVRRKK